MPRKDHPFFPHHTLEQVIQLLLLFSVLFALTLWHPAGLGERADPINTPEHVKPEWYFLAAYQMLKLVPRTVGIVGAMVFVAGLFIFPFILDRDPEKRRALKRPIFFFGAIAFMIVFVAFTIWGHYS